MDPKSALDLGLHQWLSPLIKDHLVGGHPPGGVVPPSNTPVLAIPLSEVRRNTPYRLR